MLRASLLIVALAAGCGDSVVSVPDVRFEMRDAVVDPRDQGVLDAPSDASDAAPSIDITVFDVIDGGAGGDVSVSDATAPDAPLDIPLLVDAPVTPCSELAELYATAVREATTCASASECATPVCETLCCTCQVLVAGPAPSLRVLDDLRARSLALGCSAMLPCPSTRCPAPRAGQCSSDGRCVTLRDPADAARGP